MTTSLTSVAGVGPASARILTEHGFESLAAVAGATIEQLAAVPGFSTVRAGRIIKAANELLAGATVRRVKALRPASSRRKSAATRVPAATADAPVEETTRDAAKQARPKKKKEKKAKHKKEKKAAQKAKHKKEKKAKQKKKGGKDSKK